MGVQIDGSGNLIIDGLAPGCNVQVNSINLAAVQVSVNGQGQGSFDLSGGGRAVVWGPSQGSNYFQLTGPLSGEVHCGSGNDTVYGGSGDDVIFGGPGNNMINAGAGDNVVIAGAGRNTVQSNGGHDILVGGEIKAGAVDPATLFPIASWDFLHDTALAQWKAGNASGVQTLQAACVPKTGSFASFDTLSGGQGPTAFVAHYLGGGGAPVYDSLTSYNPGKGDIRLEI